MDATGGPSPAPGPHGRDASTSPAAGLTAATHDEKLWPSVGMWLLVPLLAVGVSVSLLPVGLLVTAVGVLVAVSLAVTGLLLAAAPVRVIDGRFVAGPASIPVTLLGRPEPLHGEDARHARGPGLDARAYLLLRGWVQPMLRVPVLDPDDPTPYWLVATRRPDDLARAIEAARGAASPPPESGAGPGRDQAR